MKPQCQIAVVGDVHGHLQLALGVLARWQKELGVPFEAVFLCGDVGTFTDESQLDSATRAHFKNNPCELEFLHQWSTTPPAPWLDYIFRPEREGGLGLSCPVVMVHGNHEGHEHLASLLPPQLPQGPVRTRELPPVDTKAHIRLLPPGWTVRLPSGYLVAGVGGIEPGQRRASYHQMAYVDQEAVDRLLAAEPVDILVTHQGPSGTQGPSGSGLLQPLLDARVARVWFHGHSISEPDVTRHGRCQVVPLGDIAFHVPRNEPRRSQPYEVGTDGWALATVSERGIQVRRQPPPFYREFRRHRWTEQDGLLVCPPLAQIAWRLRAEGGRRS